MSDSGMRSVGCSRGVGRRNQSRHFLEGVVGPGSAVGVGRLIPNRERAVLSCPARRLSSLLVRVQGTLPGGRPKKERGEGGLHVKATVQIFDAPHVGLLRPKRV